MKPHPFKLPFEDSLIELKGKLNGQNLSLVLDTGASNTTIDLSWMYIAGFDVSDAIGKVDLETGKGPVEAYIFKVHSLNFLGIVQSDFQVCAYDFLSQNVLSAIDGVLGLDFFKGRDLNISFKRFEIMVE
ncbi:MAG TPA: retropepsin-like aspartic protease [Saprospiraceae bacterium]|nr:retropepsin-like aspartic protease [Saprospiraceae bacterium]